MGRCALIRLSDIGWANRITIARMVFIPVVVVVLLARLPDWGPWWAAALFAFLAATDAVDGYVARTRNQITTFGKLIDPLADKLLVTAALISLVELGAVPAWVALVIISREFIVTGLRMVAVAEGRTIAAGNFGKAKTVLQVIAIVAFILKDTDPIVALGHQAVVFANVFAWGLMGAALILTVTSMIDYFYHARDVIKIEDGPNGNKDSS
ncbi:MAG: CDP-diacylglycerol--glycerol-3-phosphate 3-phosphatidyltransferase [Actinobacteria bacterium]|nr:CDP-diacylglycerol--glycerol-3-phosphate 3-phosphatidyltransferase [Actinomycetota bacterium]